MNATEALKQARELLGRVADVVEYTWDRSAGNPCGFCGGDARGPTDPADPGYPMWRHNDRCVVPPIRAFLALPSPVEEGTWNEAVETAAKVALDADVPGYEWTGAVLISGRIRRLRRDTSKPEEKRWTWGEIETMLLASFPRFGLSRADMPDLRAALTGENP